jgi:hypothetical protein
MKSKQTSQAFRAETSLSDISFSQAIAFPNFGMMLTVPIVPNLVRIKDSVKIMVIDCMK